MLATLHLELTTLLSLQGLRTPHDVSYTTLRTYYITFITGIENPLMLATLHLELTTLLLLQRLRTP
jgi:hypothetical protein